MGKSPSAAIVELQRDKRFMGTCPICSEDFRLADATLFALDSEPPATALEAILTMREQIKERKAELGKARERMTTRAEKTAQAVNLGKIIEKIVPSFSSFSYSAGDCRALFEPIDYLIFSGLTARREVDSLLFVDVKLACTRFG
jgi:predicted Holliday junction resolvase-like endonuclease